MSIIVGNYTIASKGIAFVQVRTGRPEENLHSEFRVVEVGYLAGPTIETRLLATEASTAHAAIVAAMDSEAV